MWMKMMAWYLLLALRDIKFMLSFQVRVYIARKEKWYLTPEVSCPIISEEMLTICQWMIKTLPK